jgi:lipopolysaccharide export LptBFGC system permease protein LptF
MKNKSSMTVVKAVLILVGFMILTTLFGDYVISKEIDPFIQLAATAIWVIGSIELGKSFISLLKS